VTNRMTHSSRHLTLLLAAALPLAGCVSFAAKPPPSLLTITTAAQIPADQTQSSATGTTITIQVPTVPQAIATLRVPVQTGGSIAYLKNAQWVEPPARLFARLTADTLTAQGRVVLTPAQSFSDPGARLSGELRNFGVDGSGSAGLVTFDAALIRTAQGPVEKRRFEARVPIDRIAPHEAGAAINQAANQVAGEVAAWVGK